jgi:tetratricopeptide (TPR) repeat protein
MMNDDTQKYLDEILQKVQQGDVVSFLGAGASHAAGGPTGKKLTEMLKERFPKIDQSLNNFIDVCQDVIDTPPYNRNELEDFIRSKLEPLQPTDAHKAMTKFNWAAIFTTNFDDLIELAYRITPECSRHNHPIYSDRFQPNPADRSKIYIFKLMGSMTAIEAETGSMVLSRADYNRALIRRRRYFELLMDFVKTGTMVFIGYSFGDRLVLDVMDEIIEIYGKDRLPWSYALFKQLELDEKTRYMFSSRKIIPVECDLGSFVKYLNENYTVSKRVSKHRHFKLGGFSLELNEDEVRQLAEYFEILNEEKINQDPENRDNFFKGINKSWGAFREGWDFKRDLYVFPKFERTLDGETVIGCLKDKVFDELKKYDVNDNKVILIKGMAGIGKTMLLRRLAYDVYASGEAPVIFIRPARIAFDYKSLAGFIETLIHQRNQKVPEGKYVPPLKSLIIIDDAASMIRHVNRLKDFLTSRGRPALIVAAERTGEWDLKWRDFPFRIQKENIYELDEKLSEREKSRIVDHLCELKYISTKGTYWDDLIDKTFESSFFATVYALVHPSKKPLNEIIQDQYQNLTVFTQKAVRYICLFHQFDLPINYELLVGALKCSYPDFHSDVLEKDAAKVIFEEQDEEGNLLYRTHHRIIAEKTVQFFFGDPEMQKDYFQEIFKEATLTNRKEREICEKLFVEYIGPGAKKRIFAYDQQRQLFRTICEKNPIRSLVHHWGILETDDQNYAEAKQLLESALNLPRGDIDSYRGESDQNILTSLGNLYSHWGMEFLEEGNEAKAEEYFKEAEDSFRKSRHGEFSNAHAYHAHARMCYLRGDRAEDEPEKLDYYAKALEILTVAKDNLNEDDLRPINELGMMIWVHIGDEHKIAQYQEILRDKFKTARGYCLYAELLWQRAHLKEGYERRNLSQLALQQVEEGLVYFPNDEYVLRLRAKLLKELEPANLDAYFKALQQWNAASLLPNAWLLYELGRTAFCMGYYDISKEFFKDLETGIGVGHRLRNFPRNPIREKGRKVEFEGRVANIFSLYDGEINCDTLRSLRYPIPFRPAACRFTPSRGDLVKFYIAFSYRGPWADKVRKI